MNYLLIAIVFILLLFLMTKSATSIVKDEDRKIPYHLTSHRVSDNPCICQYVFGRLEEAGYNTATMTVEQVQNTYDVLCEQHPEYLPLYIG